MDNLISACIKPSHISHTRYMYGNDTSTVNHSCEKNGSSIIGSRWRHAGPMISVGRRYGTASWRRYSRSDLDLVFKLRAARGVYHSTPFPCKSSSTYRCISHVQTVCIFLSTSIFENRYDKRLVSNVPFGPTRALHDPMRVPLLRVFLTGKALVCFARPDLSEGRGLWKPPNSLGQYDQYDQLDQYDQRDERRCWRC